jgi:hypothetical protein
MQLCLLQQLIQRRTNMNVKMLAALFLALAWGQACAAEGSITISSPQNGATVSSNSKVPLTYAATLSPTGNHWHLNVDGKRVDILRQPKGTAELDPLPAGKHHVCLTENTVSHAPTGVETCVDITAQ